MQERKIQLIAGSTYTVSLPKKWVQKNNLKSKSSIFISETDDGSLALFPSLKEQSSLDSIKLDMDDYSPNTDQVLFALYYLGVEKINLFSKGRITSSQRARIKKTLTNMSGTEIVYEDDHNIKIKSLLDRSKVDARQIFYRISLIISSSINNLLEGGDIEEIKINENEVDRLYHLLTKMIHLSLNDAAILSSSNISRMSNVLSFFLISKRLENIADNINHLAEKLEDNHLEAKAKPVLEFIKEGVRKSVSYFTIQKDRSKVFDKTERKEISKVRKQLNELKNNNTKKYLSDSLRFLIDIEDELVNLSFFESIKES